HLQGEREHVRVGHRERVGHPEPAHARVLRDVAAVDGDVPGERGVGQLAATRADGADRRLDVQRAEPRHQAPSMFWPSTRTTCPVTPAVAAWASQPTASATSTGSPPWRRLLMRRPTSRVASGIFAVIAVSMKPGAIALTVAPRGASCGASARTIPITPALLAA